MSSKIVVEKVQYEVGIVVKQNDEKKRQKVFICLTTSSNERVAFRVPC